MAERRRFPRSVVASLEFQTVEGLMNAIGLDPSKICTYCWNGKE